MLTILELGAADTGKVGTLKTLASTTFFEAYEWGVERGVLQAHVDEAFTQDVLRGELKDPAIGYFLASIAGEPAAYLKMVEGKNSEGDHDPSLAYLERTYVLNKFQGRGIGRELMLTALDWSRRRELESIWLRVWGENKGAIAFYEKMGFRITGEMPFIVDLPDGTRFEEMNHVMSREVAKPGDR